MTHPSPAAPTSASPLPYLRAGGGIATAETSSGRVAGVERRGIKIFKNIPYATAARFAAPRAHPGWAGIRSVKQYGPVCPQPPRTMWGFDEVAWMFDWQDGHADEDCLNLNIWTPGLDDGQRRPVMVWLHGGGFEAGSAHELAAYDGENLSRGGDVVVISLNHRLGVLGFLAITDGEGLNGTNLGLLDIVAALRWVRENASRVGGDPQNVTLFGQSGGGGKINALMAMPTAAGLFHRAISQSAAFPSYRHMAGPVESARLTDGVLRHLGLSAAQTGKLRDLPLAGLMEAGIAAHAALHVAWRPDVIDPSQSWAPTVDGVILPEAPFATAAPAISAHIPLLLGTVQNELSPALYDASQINLTEAGLRARVTVLHGDRAGQIIAAFRAAHPKTTPVQLISRISSAVFRQNVLEQAAMQSAVGKAWLYLFAWRTPLLDDRPGAFHCADLPFMFDNTDRAETMTGGGPVARALARRVASSWVHFARAGTPSGAGLGTWPVFSAVDRGTMVIDHSPVYRTRLDDRELATLV